MTYNKTTWVSGRGRGQYAPGATKLNAAHLQNIEDGIESVDTRVAALESGLEITPGSPAVLNGTGSPEGVITAPVGTLYLRTDGGGVALYAKQSGVGNIGWFALYGSTPDPFPDPGAASPLAAYGFNEGSGLSAYDVSGNAHTLTASNTSTSWSSSSPKYGAAVGKKQFTGLPGPDQNQPNYTIMFWVRREGTWVGNAGMFTNPNQVLWIEASNATSYQVHFFAGISSAVSTTLLALNTWTHIACTHDSLGATKIYVNGALEGTQTGNTAVLNFGSGGPFVVAGASATAVEDADWNGSIDDLRIFGQVLTAAEITTWMGTGITEIGGPPASGGGGGGSWLSGASGDSTNATAATGTFGTWRGTAVAIGGTWLNETPCYPFQPGFTWANWTGPMDVGIIPFTWNGWASEAAGGNDSFWTQTFATLASLRSGKGTTYVRMWYEFNGDWMNYSVRNATDLANFRTAWNRVAAIARAQFPAVKLCLGAAAAYKNGITISSAWPTATVDALSIDFYNRWPFSDTQAEFDSAIINGGGVNSLENLRLLAYQKGVPVIVSEWGNQGIDAGDGGGGGESAAFIDAMYNWFSTNAGTGPGNVLGEVYFNLWNQFYLYNGSASIYQPTTAARYVTKF